MSLRVRQRARMQIAVPLLAALYRWYLTPQSLHAALMREPHSLLQHTMLPYGGFQPLITIMCQLSSGY